jgi:uncharacterized surface protein with fasciclin (FAS1) repeats
MEKQTFCLIPALAVIALFSCKAPGQKNGRKAGPAAIRMTTTTVMATPGPAEAVVATVDMATDTSNSITGYISKARDLTTLAAALKATAMETQLNGKGPFTVFAPDNEAFNKLPVGVVDALIEAREKTGLNNILSYHIVAGKYNASDLKDGMELTSLQGARLRIRHRKGHWMVNNAKVVTGPSASKNGVLWVIDKVMLP